MMRKIDINYSIDEFGNVFKNGKQIKKTLRKDKGTYTVYINGKRKGLALLVAEHFLNTKGRNVIFKDRNRTNCHYSNLMFLDNKNYRTYCGLHKVPKKTMCHLKAALQAKCEYLKKYYLTGNDLFLLKSWEVVLSRLNKKFNDILDDLYLYFIDRTSRKTLIGDPTGLLIMYAKGIKKVQFNDNSSLHTGGMAGN